MKFSITSFHPFAWISRPPMSEEEIICYDLNQELQTIRAEIRDLNLQQIDLRYQEASLEQRIDYLQSQGICQNEKESE